MYYQDPFADPEKAAALTRCQEQLATPEEKAEVDALLQRYTQIQYQLATVQRRAGLVVGAVALLGRQRYRRLDRAVCPFDNDEFDLVVLGPTSRATSGAGSLPLDDELAGVPLVLGRAPNWSLVRGGMLRESRILSEPLTKLYVSYADDSALPGSASRCEQEWLHTERGGNNALLGAIFSYGTWNSINSLWVPAATPARFGPCGVD